MSSHTGRKWKIECSIVQRHKFLHRTKRGGKNQTWLQNIVLRSCHPLNLVSIITTVGYFNTKKNAQSFANLLSHSVISVEVEMCWWQWKDPVDWTQENNSSALTMSRRNDRKYYLKEIMPILPLCRYYMKQQQKVWDFPLHVCQHQPCSGKLSVCMSSELPSLWVHTHPQCLMCIHYLHELDQFAFVRWAAGLKFTPE